MRNKNVGVLGSNNVCGGLVMLNVSLLRVMLSMVSPCRKDCECYGEWESHSGEVRLGEGVWE